MTIPVIHAPRAAAEIRAITLYLAEQNPVGVRRLRAAMAAAERQLAEFPESGAPGVVSGTRRLVVGNYIVHYRRRGGAVEIFAVRHASRRDAREPR